MAQAAEHGIEMIDMVVVNLYAFEKTVESGADFGTCIENIDIGGPSMLRSAAKNFESVAVVTRPASYDAILAEMRANDGATLRDTRAKLALDVFETTAAYDGAIAAWMGAQLKDEGDVKFPADRTLRLSKVQDLRYGENPYQSAAFYRRDDYADAPHSLAHAKQHQGKELSYNNYLDLDAAWTAVREFDEPACVIVKHLTPCGVCQNDDLVEAYQRAHACDPVSAYGGVIACNTPVTLEMAESVRPIFTEVIVAPAYEDAALELLKTKKKNLRILKVSEPPKGHTQFRQIDGGLLVQDMDLINATGDDPDAWKLVAGEPADEATLKDLVFAWRAIRCVKSNAILLAHDQATVGIGMGQVNRVDSCHLAVDRANTLADGADRATGSVAASDAFFPFADGAETLMNAGVKAIVQPGGSIRDEEVIEAAKKAGVTMYLTGTRHFFH